MVDISIPSMLPQIVEIKQNLTDPFDIMPLLIPREQDTHKGDYGRVLLIGGSKGMSGAPIMAAQAASRCGAGLVTVAVPEPLLPVMENGLLEELKAGLPADANGLLTADALDVALALARNMTVIALGPGLGRSPGVTTFVRGLVEKTDLPLVIDADGLNAIAGALHLLPRPDRQVILTPHPGEAARLLNKSAEEIQNDRVGAARELAKRTGAIVALKGAHTVIAEPEGEVWINPTGNPGMAKGGMGDVLTGMIVGSIADGVPPLLAAISSVYLHGKAGDLARDDLGERAVTAGEVLQRLPRALDEIERSFRGEQTEGEHD
jgi:NAD(P)H-hydrate epimerase